MKQLVSAIAILLTLFLLPGSLKAVELVRHDLRIVLHPEEHRFTAQDIVTVPEDLLPELQFLLHQGLEPSSPTPGVRIVMESDRSGSVPLETFKVRLPPWQSTFVLEYGGSIYHPLEAYGKEQARGFRQTPGLISAEGVYLAGSSFWYMFTRGI
jgi:hypothetical protein